MWVNLSVEMPRRLTDGASILWLDNGRPISAGTFNAQSVLWEPGVHIIEARLTLADDRSTLLRETITVLPPASSQPTSP